MRTFARPGDLVGAAGVRLGRSPYHPVQQHEVDVFAALTGDRQWIHVDPERARTGPYGGPVAQGAYVLSLVMPLLAEVFTVDSAAVVLNKGFDRVRFLSPVPVGARVRVAAELRSAVPRSPSYTEAVITTAVEVEGQEWPVCTADVHLLYEEKATEGWLPLAS
jgi:acyl dehydratase